MDAVVVKVEDEVMVAEVEAEEAEEVEEEVMMEDGEEAHVVVVAAVEEDEADRLEAAEHQSLVER